MPYTDLIQYKKDYKVYSVYTKIKNLNQSHTSSYVKFIENAKIYLASLDDKSTQVSALYRLRSFFRNKFKDLKPALEIQFLCFLFEFTKDSKRGLFNKIEQSNNALKELETKIRNSQTRLNLLKFINSSVRTSTQE